MKLNVVLPMMIGFSGLSIIFRLDHYICLPNILGVLYYTEIRAIMLFAVRSPFLLRLLINFSFPKYGRSLWKRREHNSTAGYDRNRLSISSVFSYICVPMLSFIVNHYLFPPPRSVKTSPSREWKYERTWNKLTPKLVTLTPRTIPQFLFRKVGNTMNPQSNSRVLNLIFLSKKLVNCSFAMRIRKQRGERHRFHASSSGAMIKMWQAERRPTLCVLSVQ